MEHGYTQKMYGIELPALASWDGIPHQKKHTPEWLLP